MRAWPMSEEGLLSFTSLPMSKNPVGSPESTSESPSPSPAGLYSSFVPQREREACQGQLLHGLDRDG